MGFDLKCFVPAHITQKRTSKNDLYVLMEKVSSSIGGVFSMKKLQYHFSTGAFQPRRVVMLTLVIGHNTCSTESMVRDVISYHCCVGILVETKFIGV